jgi:folate-binding protein YgfZ
MKRTALSALHEARGARWREYHGWEIPASYGGIDQEYQALQEGVGLIDRSYRQKLRISGRDRRTWLHGQVTQDINGLADWRSAYAAVLTPQGQMVSDLRVVALPDALLLDFPAGTTAPMAEYLDRFLIMERVELEDLTEAWALLSLQGPLSCHALATLFGGGVADLEPNAAAEYRFGDEPLYVVRAAHCGEDGYDLFVPAAEAAALWAALCQSRTQFAVHSVGWEAFNVRRTEAGIPWWGQDLDEKTVPPEARLDRAVSMTKGCYVGQEIIARIDARGHVNNLLTGFFVQGDTLPERGAELQVEGKKVGRVTTALQSLRLGRSIALGYLRREHQAPGTRVQATGLDGPIELEVTALPFVPNDYP